MSVSTSRFLSVLMVLALGFAVHAQADSLAVGGPDDANTYEEEGEGLVSDEDLPLEGWSLEDSLLNIPGYAHYGDWNTDVIFPRGAEITDTVNLLLAHAACDHEFPVCGKITSPFGPRNHRMHYGVDIKLQTGDPVVCAFEGLVRISRYHKQFGHVVVVRHTSGLETLYAHLSQRSVEVGDHVMAGALVGLGGNTGRSTGSHLHFEVRYLGRPIDPQLVFDVAEGELRSNTLSIHAGTFQAVERAKAALRASRYHKVRSGETLSAISRRYGVSVSKLCKLNGIRTSSVLRVGQRIRYN